MEKDSRSFRNRWIQRCAEMGNAYRKEATTRKTCIANEAICYFSGAIQSICIRRNTLLRVLVSPFKSY